jgi:hypothetical protein
MPSAQTSPGLVCLLTVHGIGFQQQPQPPDLPGYADRLHQNLHAAMGASLGDDPNRERLRAGDAGPVYVASEWPPRSGDIDAGLDRIAQLTPDKGLDWSRRPLAGTGARVAHVAVVYAGLESTRPHVWVGLRALGVALIHLNRYASPLALFRLVRRDLAAIQPAGPPAVAPDPTGPVPPPPAENHVRQDIPHRRLLPHPRRKRHQPPGSTSTDALVQLEDDVASYVYNRQLHSRVHDFVSDVVERLLARDDIATVVVNAHSQGSVVCYEVLQKLSAKRVGRVGAFVTAGSPLRKYVDFFDLSSDLSGAGEVPWLNFWDPLDPVADPLTPPREWRPLTDAHVAVGQVGLFRRRRAGGFTALAHMSDREVNNLANSAGPGLRAHNYWDNQAQFTRHLAGVLGELAGMTPSSSPPGPA